MILTLLLAAAYGSADMSFPWWVWALAALDTGVPGVVRVVKEVRS